MSNTIAFFDFDGTITTKDCLSGFIRFSVGEMRFIKGLLVLSFVFAAYKLKLISNYTVKQIVTSWFFKGMKEETFRKSVEDFSRSIIPAVIRPKAIEQIKWHKDRGHRVVVVSASLECYLKPWCDINELELEATKLEFKNGTVTGKLQDGNCYGIEKVRRIKEKYNLKNYDLIYAYGDSRGDKELLALADKSFYKPFR